MKGTLHTWVGITVSVAVAGNGTFGFASGDPLQAQFANPEGTAVDAAGNIFILETAGHRIRRVGIP